jgi:hypothetical protein
MKPKEVQAATDIQEYNKLKTTNEHHHPNGRYR